MSSLRKAKIDKRSGDSSSGSDAEEQDLLVSGVTRSRGTEVQVSLLRFDPGSRLQSILLHTVHNTLEAYRLFRRLGEWQLESTAAVCALAQQQDSATAYHTSCSDLQ